MKKGYLLLLVLILFVTSLFSQSTNIYVSPTGADTGMGINTTSPVSLNRARSIAKLSANKLVPCNIWLLDGIYTYLALDSTDSRTANAPVTYHSLHRFGASFQPITPINPGDLMPITDSIKNRILDSTAKTKVMQVDLSKYNVSNMSPWPKLFGYPVTVTVTGSNRQNWPLIYQNTTPLPMSQYPKGDSVMRMKTVLNNGGTGTGGSAGIFKYRDGRCKYWTQTIKEGLWLRGNWRVPWQMDFVKTDSINFKDSIVYQSVGVQGGIGNKYTRPAGNGQEPYIAVNLIEEIAMPGEWAIDFNRKMLYIYPPDSGTLNISSNSSTPTISLTKVNYINFEGITLNGGSGIGIKLSGCNNVLIVGTEIKHTSSYGVLIADGSNCTVRSNDIHDVGEGGVYVISSTFSADQLLLKSCNHKIINNHIYNYAKDVFIYAAAIDTRNAIGCYSTYNTIHGCPHVGVLFGGNNNVYEYNDVSNVVTTYNDMGAFYTAESATKRGNKIQNNYIHAMNYCGSALYADNNSQGNTFNKNIAVNCLYGVQNNFGLFNRFNYNLYFDNYKYQCTYAIGGDTSLTSNIYTNVKATYTKSITYQNAYPELKDYFDTVNTAYTSQVWTQINGCVFLGTSINTGKCISIAWDSLLFLSSGKTNTKYAVSGAAFTKSRLICNNNFLAKTSLLKAGFTNTLDSLKATGIFSKTALTDWHIDRIGLFKDSIYRPDISLTQTAGKAPSFSVVIKSLHSFTATDTLNITVTIKNPNIKNCYSAVKLYDSGFVLPSVPFTLSKSSFDSMVLTAKWINPAVGNHLLSVHLLDSTLWDFASDSTLITIKASLPVNIIGFKGIPKGCNAQLSWKVGDENGIKSYQIEQEKYDGSFEVVKTILPNTNPYNLNYTTEIPQATDKAGYRLHVVSTTTDCYSQAVLVTTTCVENSIFTLSPNPIYSGKTNTLTLKYYYIGGNNASTIVIYNASGKVVAQQNISIHNGHNEYNFPIQSLPKGLYIVQLAETGLTQKLIVL